MSGSDLPAYLLAKLTIKNAEEYMEKYGGPVAGQVAGFGGEILSVSQAPDVREGEWDSNWTVLIKFPSMAAAKDFYTSADYAPFIALRQNELTEGGSLVILEGFDPAAHGL